MSPQSRQNLIVALLAFLVFVLGAMVIQLQRERGEASRKATSIEQEIAKPGEPLNQKLQKFNLKGFDEKGKLFWHLEGDTAKIEPGQVVYLDENVTFRFEGNTIVRTDHVQWSPQTSTLTTKEPVYVIHENAEMQGIGAIGKPKENFVQINRDIQMVINEKTKLTCDGPLKLYSKENKCIFYRKVKIVDERGTLESSRMDVIFDPETKKVTQVLARGNVVIRRGEDVTRSDRATYTVATGAVRLEGNPDLTFHKATASMLDASIRN